MSKIVPDYLQGWKLVPDDNYEQVCTTKLVVTTGLADELRVVTGLWIPVTERLPEKGGLYFVTKENEYGRYVATEWFYQDKTWSTGWKVVAWMPMPKPYMEGAE